MRLCHLSRPPFCYENRVGDGLFRVGLLDERVSAPLFSHNEPQL